MHGSRSSESWLQPQISYEQPPAKKPKLVPGQALPQQLTNQRHSWMDPPVAQCKTDEAGCMVAGQVQGGSHRSWLKPGVAASSAGQGLQKYVNREPQDSAHREPTPVVDLTLAAAFLATQATTDKILELSKQQTERVQKVLATPCVGSFAARRNGCSRCTSNLDAKEVAIFCGVFATLSCTDQVRLLHGVYNLSLNHI